MIKLRKDPDLMTHRMHELLYLGSEHGICRDDAYQIMDICLEEAKLAA